MFVREKSGKDFKELICLNSTAQC